MVEKTESSIMDDNENYLEVTLLELLVRALSSVPIASLRAILIASSLTPNALLIIAVV